MGVGVLAALVLALPACERGHAGGRAAAEPASPAAEAIISEGDRKVREELNVSQAVFAKYLNISPRTVQSWEQGYGKPSGASLKLLSIAKKNPKVLV